MWEEMKQLNVEYKHTLRDVKHPIVPDSLLVSSSLKASEIVVLAWTCLTIKVLDFYVEFQKRMLRKNTSCFCCNSNSAYACASIPIEIWHCAWLLGFPCGYYAILFNIKSSNCVAFWQRKEYVLYICYWLCIFVLWDVVVFCDLTISNSTDWIGYRRVIQGFTECVVCWQCQVRLLNGSDP